MLFVPDDPRRAPTISRGFIPRPQARVEVVPCPWDKTGDEAGDPAHYSRDWQTRRADLERDGGRDGGGTGEGELLTGHTPSTCAAHTLKCSHHVAPVTPPPTPPSLSSPSGHRLMLFPLVPEPLHLLPTSIISDGFSVI